MQVDVVGGDIDPIASGWQKSDIITLIACLLSLPPAFAAGYTLLEARRAARKRKEGW